MRRVLVGFANSTPPRRTPRFAAAVSLLTSVAVFISGCRAPFYVCHPANPTPILNVKLDDQRPKWERDYYLGGALNDITFIPGERISPAPWEQLRQQLESKLAAHGVPATEMSFRMIACRVVLNGKGNPRKKYVSVLDRDIHVTDTTDVHIGATPQTSHALKDQRGYVDPSEKDKDDLEDELAGFAFVATLYAAGVATYESLRHVGHWLHLRPGHAGPPSKLDTRGYAYGTTFEMFGDLTVTMPSGEAKTVYVRQVNVMRSPHGAATESVKQVVAIGTAEAAELAVSDLLGIPRPAPPTQAIVPAGYTPITPQQAASASSAGGADAWVLEETRRIQEANRRQYEAEFTPR